MRLRTPGAIDQAIATLDERIMECGNLNAKFGDAARAKRVYTEWADETYRLLGNHFADGRLAEELFSPTYWQIVQLGDYSSLMFDLVRREMSVQTARLTQAKERLINLKRFVGREGIIVVPDTSAFVQGVYLTEFDWRKGLGLDGAVRLVVPILVVEELDRIKSFERGRRQDRARSVLKAMREKLRPLPPGGAARLREGVTIEVLVDDDWHQRRANNDSEIIQQALVIRDLTAKEVLLVCVDAAMEFRARELGLKVFAMPEPNEDVPNAG